MPKFITFIVSILLSAAAVTNVRAIDAPEGTVDSIDPLPKWSFVITANVRSEYVDPYGITESNHPVTQSEVTITSPSGVYLDLWHSHQLSRPGDLSYDLGDEVDATIGWSGTLWEKKPYSIDIDLGLTYEDYVGLGKAQGDILLPYLELGHEFDLGKAVTVEPFVRLEYSIPVDGNPNGDLSGSFLFLGAKINAELSSKWSLNEKIQFETDDGAFGYKPGGVVADLTTTVSYKLTDAMSLNAEVRLTKSLNDSAEKGSAVILGLGATWTF